VQLRLRGSSDLQVFEEIFVDDVYAGLRDLREPAVILDLGANIGLSSAYFLSAFPGTRVIAVEPDERNLAVCRANLAAYGERATVMAGAVWRSCGRLRLVRGEFGDGREWATQVAEESDGVSAAGAVTAWDMPALIALNRAASIDLLKVNIERAELAVFGPGSAVWLARVRNICIELHGPECEAAFFGALSGFEYDLLRTGEWTICRNLRPKATP
jgi:FkbM family methyltransferase